MSIKDNIYLQVVFDKVLNPDAIMNNRYFNCSVFDSKYWNIAEAVDVAYGSLLSQRSVIWLLSGGTIKVWLLRWSAWFSAAPLQSVFSQTLARRASNLRFTERRAAQYCRNAHWRFSLLPPAAMTVRARSDGRLRRFPGRRQLCEVSMVWAP